MLFFTFIAHVEVDPLLLHGETEHVTSERVDVSHWSEGYLISLCREWICFVRFDFVLHTLNVTNCYLYIVSIISDLKSSLSSRVYFLIFSSYSK